MSLPWRLSRLGWVPRLECLGSEWSRKKCLVVSPLQKDLGNLQLWECVRGGGGGAGGGEGGPPAAKPSLLHPKAAGTSGMGEL